MQKVDAEAQELIPHDPESLLPSISRNIDQADHSGLSKRNKLV